MDHLLRRQKTNLESFFSASHLEASNASKQLVADWSIEIDSRRLLAESTNEMADPEFYEVFKTFFSS